MVTTTGISLRTLDSRDLFDAAYALMSETALRTEDEAKALDRLDQMIRDSQYEQETGMPAITQWLRPANEMVGPSDG